MTSGGNHVKLKPDLRLALAEARYAPRRSRYRSKVLSGVTHVDIEAIGVAQHEVMDVSPRAEQLVTLRLVAHPFWNSL